MACRFEEQRYPMSICCCTNERVSSRNSVCALSDILLSHRRQAIHALRRVRGACASKQQSRS